MRRGCRAIGAAVVCAALLAPPAAARAAACCLSTSSFGAGRLAVWEEAAAGASVSLSTAPGRYDADGAFRAHEGYVEREARLTAFALLRLTRSLEAGARFPWVAGHRAAAGVEEDGHGPGDLALSLRWQAIDLGAWEELPGVALTLGANLPTGRSTAESDAALGADVTGRGYGVLSAGVSVERADGPWYVRLDAAALLPLAHEVQGRRWRARPGAELQLGGGVDLGAGVVVSLAPRLRWESDAIREGERVPGSSTLEIGLGPAASWAITPHWTLQAAFDTGLPMDGLGRNRPLFTAATVGIRRGIF